MYCQVISVRRDQVIIVVFTEAHKLNSIYACRSSHDLVLHCLLVSFHARTSLWPCHSISIRTYM
jgi:hypothetical protein